MGNNLPKIIIFDLDGTLTVSKQRLDDEMVEMLAKLLRKTKVAITSGGKWGQFLKQVVEPLEKYRKLFGNLYIFPTCGGAFYWYKDKEWQPVYEHLLSSEQEKKIMAAFEKTFEEIGFEQPKKIYGEQIEKRGTQITFSALGQLAPVSEKVKWDPDLSKRKKIVAVLERLLPEFQIAFGGMTSIDINLKGINKAYALQQIEKLFGIKISEMLYVGDKLEPGGNDYVVVPTGVKTKAVSDIKETKIFLKNLLAV
jgi:hypothetical protein